MPQEDLDELTKVRKREAAYTVISQKRIPEQILEKAKKASVHTVEKHNTN